MNIVFSLFLFLFSSLLGATDKRITREEFLAQLDLSENPAGWNYEKNTYEETITQIGKAYQTTIHVYEYGTQACYAIWKHLEAWKTDKNALSDSEALAFMMDAEFLFAKMGAHFRSKNFYNLAQKYMYQRVLFEDLLVDESFESLSFLKPV